MNIAISSYIVFGIVIVRIHKISKKHREKTVIKWGVKPKANTIDGRNEIHIIKKTTTL